MNEYESFFFTGKNASVANSRKVIAL